MGGWKTLGAAVVALLAGCDKQESSQTTKYAPVVSRQEFSQIAKDAPVAAKETTKTCSCGWAHDPSEGHYTYGGKQYPTSEPYAFRMSKEYQEMPDIFYWDYQYEVLPGDTLESIAEKIHGDKKQWQKIFENSNVYCALSQKGFGGRPLIEELPLELIEKHGLNAELLRKRGIKLVEKREVVNEDWFNRCEKKLTRYAKLFPLQEETIDPANPVALKPGQRLTVYLTFRQAHELQQKQPEIKLYK
jgi:hypothetical protein